MGKRALGSTAILLALLGGLVATGEVSIASAASHPHSKLTASGGDKTRVDRDGTQGKFTDAVQGVEDSDGDQDATDMITSQQAVPQTKSPNTMTKK